ncbi:Ribulose-5-phosphate reductase [Fusobacterium necrophorum]|nr:alcohol dehydrogenase catalytic domain-containing protein [Fusobacterium necrophorum]MBR8823893.1 Ribulose-5-phosphate reductase [Fusobacterium necrophorum]
MINQVYQLIAPRNISIKHKEIILQEGEVIVKPKYLSLCHADQRYYTGNRDKKVLAKKLPMALIHECCGEVIFDPKNEYKVGQMVVTIPNIPGDFNEEIYENYAKGSKFLSSGIDGFMREYVNISRNRIVMSDKINYEIMAITEFVSIGFHILKRFLQNSHSFKNHLAIWGDGNLAFVVANILRVKFPNAKITVLGKNREKLALFSFVDQVLIVDQIPEKFHPDHIFECVGGEGSQYAISDIIRTISPQGSVMLGGVSENSVPMNTRGILEKGLIFLGCSRSGYDDFQNAIAFLEDKKIQKRLSAIIRYFGEVCSVEDIHKVFEFDLLNPYKTVFKWKV